MTYDICIAAGPYNKQGGIERYNVELVRALKKEGHRVHLIVTQVDYDTSNIDEVIPLRTNIPFHPLAALVNAARVSRLRADFKKRFPKGIFIVSGLPSWSADIVIMHSVHLRSVRATNAREPRTAKGFVRRFLRLVYPANAIAILNEWFLVTRGAQLLIAISEKAKKETIATYGIDERKIAVVYEGVNPADFHPDVEARRRLRKESGFSDDGFMFLFSGHEFKRKGLRYAVLALGKLHDDDVRLVVAGRDKSEAIRQMAEDLRLTGRVIFIGSRNDFSDWCAAADAFLFPTLEDAFGLVIVEAMAAGLPVITSGPAYAGAAERLKDGFNAILLDDPTDVEKMAAAMSRLVKDERLRASLGANARKAALDFSWDRTARGIVGAWESHVK